jgi:hypothetical protein
MADRRPRHAARTSRDPSAANPFQSLTEALDEAVQLIDAAEGVEGRGLLGAIESARHTLSAAGAEAVVVPPEARLAWLHDLRGLVSGIAGWARVLRVSADDEARRLRAVEAIERNAKLLTERLAHPPG